MRDDWVGFIDEQGALVEKKSLLEAFACCRDAGTRESHRRRSLGLRIEALALASFLLLAGILLALPGRQWGWLFVGIGLILIGKNLVRRCLERRAHLLDGVGGMLPQQVAMVRDCDVLVAASFPPFSPQVAGVFVDCHERGVPTISITDSPVSPLALEASVAFHIKQQEEGSFRSLVAPMCLAQSLVVALGYYLGGTKNAAARR